MAGFETHQPSGKFQQTQLHFLNDIPKSHLCQGNNEEPSVNDKFKEHGVFCRAPLERLIRWHSVIGNHEPTDLHSLLFGGYACITIFSSSILAALILGNGSL